MKRFFVIFPIIFLVSCGNTEEFSPKPIKTAFVSSGTLSEMDAVSDFVRGDNSAKLAFKGGGRISEVLVSIGQTVKK